MGLWGFEPGVDSKPEGRRAPEVEELDVASTSERKRKLKNRKNKL